MCSSYFKALRAAFALLALGALSFAAPLSASAAGACPSSNAIGNFKADSFLSVSITIGPGFASYDFTSSNANPVGGVPGLIAYCVYPPQPPGNPDGIQPLYPNGTGDNEIVDSDSLAGIEPLYPNDTGDWLGAMKPNQGYFAFVRPEGNPTNVPFDGSTQVIGTATWTDGAPGDGTGVLLHINDPTECNLLYGGNPGTCFVFPTTIILEGRNPPPV